MLLSILWVFINLTLLSIPAPHQHEGGIMDKENVVCLYTEIHKRDFQWLNLRLPMHGGRAQPLVKEPRSQRPPGQKNTKHKTETIL